jgi:hypothetical protein
MEREREEMDGEAMPPPPSMWSFVERSRGRILLEVILGASAGFILAGAFEYEALRWHFALAGGVAAPIALLLTPMRGGPWYRAVRYGGALAVLLTLVVSFAGQGRERPIDELLLWGVFFFFLGAMGHAAMVLTVDRGVGAVPEVEE